MLFYNYTDPNRETETPVKEPETAPNEPKQNPDKEENPSEWDFPAPAIEPTPKAIFFALK